MRSDLVQHNMHVVQEHFHSEDIGAIEAAIELYTDDIVWESPARQFTAVGKEAVAGLYRRMFASFADVEEVPVQRFATEDRVVDDSILKFTLVGDGLVNSPVPIGTRVELRFVHIFEMRDGKIAKEQVFEMWPQAPATGRLSS